SQKPACRDPGDGASNGTGSNDVTGFLETFGERLAGIARSHDVLTNRGWGAIPVMDLINVHMGSFLEASGRIECRGPDVALQASAAQDLGMVLHELATNAVQYGALPAPSGQVNIEWRILAGLAGKHGLEVRWNETGGPAVILRLSLYAPYCAQALPDVRTRGGGYA